jgi:3-hydroxyisobutyrate dehydrogenase
MGKPMAANLARAGFAVQSFDRNGTGNRGSAREAARGADVLITMLPDGDAVRDAVLEALPALREGAVVVDMSSSDPAATRALAPALRSRRIDLVDAPVSGAIAKAKDATLAIMVGGESEALEKVRPILQAMGSDVFHVGPLGAGHAVKALNNYLGAAGTLAGFEALRIARAFGLEPRPMLEAINASTGRNSTTERKIPQQVLTGAFASGFKLALMAKDVGIAARLAGDLGVAAPYLEKTLQLWRAAQKALPAAADHTEIFRFLESVRPKRAAARARRAAPPSPGARAPRSKPRRKPRRPSAPAARRRPGAAASSRARGQAAGSPARGRPRRA